MKAPPVLSTTVSFGLALAAATGSAFGLGDPFKPGKLEQVKLGQQIAADIRKESKVVPPTDPRSKVVQEVFGRLMAARTEQQRKEPWQFSVDLIESDEVNAFALPGGPLFVYTGLLERLKTRDELAGILGHEMTHVFREHWAYSVRDQQKRQIGMLVVLGLAKANRDWYQLAGAGDVLLVTLPGSRNHEYQADESGFDLATRAGYNPQGMVDVFRMFNSLPGQTKGPEFMSTHPDDRARIKRIEDRIAQSRTTYPPQTRLRASERFRVRIPK